MNKSRILIFMIVTLFPLACSAQEIKTNFISSIETTNYPQVAFWFFAVNMMPGKGYIGKIDSFVKYSKYTLINLTRRDRCDLYNIKSMHAIFKKLVAYVHKKGLMICLQVWKGNRDTLIENTDRIMQDGEIVLDHDFKASYQVKSKGARDMHTLIKSNLFKIYAYQKMA